MSERRVISFSLWGSSPKYLVGSLENVRIAGDVYPGWTCRFYVNCSIPNEHRLSLMSLGAEVVHVDDPDVVWNGLFWRFLVAADSTVGRFLVRDCDSRPSSREARAVGEWIASGKMFHSMRDHPGHIGMPMLGGMWGARCGAVEDMSGLIQRWQAPRPPTTRGHDQFFLTEVVYPMARDSIVVHDPVTAGDSRYPTDRVGLEFVGEIHEADGTVNARDRERLRTAIESGKFK